jgi:hypothetical protein
MSDEILRYTDLAAAIQLAKAAGMTTREIVRELTGGSPLQSLCGCGETNEAHASSSRARKRSL